MAPKSRKERIETLRRGMRIIVVSESAGAILPQVLFEGGIISLMILSLGGADLHIGIISTITNISLAMGLFLIPYLEVRPLKKLIIFWLLIAVAVCPFLFLTYPLNSLVGLNAAFGLLALTVFINRSANFLAWTAWWPYIADLVPSPLRGRFLGKMRMAWRLTSSAAILISGWILGGSPGSGRFYLVIGFGFLFYLWRIFMIQGLPDLPVKRKGPPESLFRGLIRPLADTRFRCFLLFIILVYGMTAAAYPFFVPFLKTELGFPSSAVVYSSAFTSIGSIVSLMVWGKLADRWGNRFVFFLGIVISGASCAVIVFTPHFDQSKISAFFTASLSFLLRGVGSAGVSIAFAIRMMHESPEENGGAYMTVSRMVLGLATGIGPVIMGGVFEYLPNDLWLFHRDIMTKRVFFAVMSILVLGTAAGLKFLKRLKEKGGREIIRSILKIRRRS